MTNPNIQIETPPAKTRAKSQNLEGKIQASIVKWFSQQFPERRGALVGYFAETFDKRDGGIKTAKGLVESVSDLMYFDKKMLIGIEVKAKKTEHNVVHLRKQAQWILDFCEDGCFVDSLEQAKNFILHGIHGTSPNKVLEKLKDVKVTSILWDKCTV